MIKIWVDDERQMPEGYDIWIKTVWEAIIEISWWISRGEEVLIDIDHDAGEYASEGGDYINILKAYETGVGRSCFTMQSTKLKVHFHSANPIGVKNMRTIVERCPWMRELK